MAFSIENKKPVDRCLIVTAKSLLKVEAVLETLD
jgi:hypothetical protein